MLLPIEHAASLVATKLHRLMQNHAPTTYAYPNLDALL